MFLKLLDKLGRKKVVLDRGPSHPKFNEAKPWMNRYYVLLRHRPKWFPFNILLHEMLTDDHGEGVHNHTFPYITVILRGGYWETLILEDFGDRLDTLVSGQQIICIGLILNQTQDRLLCLYLDPLD